MSILLLATYNNTRFVDSFTEIGGPLAGAFRTGSNLARIIIDDMPEYICTAGYLCTFRKPQET